MKNLIILSFFALAFVGKAQAQVNSTEKAPKAETITKAQPVIAEALSTATADKNGKAVKTFNNGYYIWEITGDAATDNANRIQAANQFKQNNPALHNQLSRDPETVQPILNDEFQKLPAAKQQYILANPAKYPVVSQPNNQ